MTQEAAVPPGLMAQIRQIAREEAATVYRSAPNRSATVSSGGFTVKGGFLRMVYGAYNLFYVGPLTIPALPDGSFQQGVRLRRSDGTIALEIRDAFPDPDGTLKQAMTWFDRDANAVFADDTDSGQGIARPYVPGVFYLSRSTDWPVVTSTTFETVYRAKMPKQQPKLLVRLWGVNDTVGATGEVKVLVNGTPFGSTGATTNGVVTEFTFGPLAVAGSHMSTLNVEIQARMDTGTGGVRVSAESIEGRQT